LKGLVFWVLFIFLKIPYERVILKTFFLNSPLKHQNQTIEASFDHFLAFLAAFRRLGSRLDKK